jgi:uncharacterized protein YjbJ (UPF0337 family)
MDEDGINGSANHARGAIKEAVGEMAGARDALRDAKHD